MELSTSHITRPSRSGSLNLLLCAAGAVEHISSCCPPQDLCADLEAQEEQAEAVLKEVELVSRVASPQVMEALSVDCSRLREAISHTKDLIHLKREERDKGLLKVIKGWSSVCWLDVDVLPPSFTRVLFGISHNVFSFSPDGSQSFEGWFQDLQLSVNECFENPESRTDVEIYLQRLSVSRLSGGFTLRVDG